MLPLPLLWPAKAFERKDVRVFDVIVLLLLLLLLFLLLEENEEGRAAFPVIVGGRNELARVRVSALRAALETA